MHFGTMCPRERRFLIFLLLVAGGTLRREGSNRLARIRPRSQRPAILTAQQIDSSNVTRLKVACRYDTRPATPLSAPQIAPAETPVSADIDGHKILRGRRPLFV